MVKEVKYIKSPINYTGNKYRLLPQFEKFLPNECDVFVDLFCGGATVGINVNAKRVIFIDNNPRVISLLNFLAFTDTDSLIDAIEKNIEKYGLTYSAKYGYDKYKKKHKDNNGLKEFNKAGFYKLRDEYNALVEKDTEDANAMLYVLMVYGFNNDLRFNKNGEYNLPVGKTDFNRNNLKKIIDFNHRAKNRDISFICTNYDSEEALGYIDSADFVYIDPPYLITTAVYNEGNNWNDEMEISLLNLLKRLDANGKKFALSNVLTKVGVENKFLKQWLGEVKGAKINHMVYSYRSCSYNKKDRDANEQEVLITN